MSDEDGAIVMQLTVTRRSEGLQIDTFFADGYDEESLADAFEAWSDEVLDPNPSPGWGRL